MRADSEHPMSKIESFITSNFPHNWQIDIGSYSSIYQDLQNPFQFTVKEWWDYLDGESAQTLEKAFTKIQNILFPELSDEDKLIDNIREIQAKAFLEAYLDDRTSIVKKKGLNIDFAPVYELNKLSWSGISAKEIINLWKAENILCKLLVVQGMSKLNLPIQKVTYLYLLNKLVAKLFTTLKKIKGQFIEGKALEIYVKDIISQRYDTPAFVNESHIDFSLFEPLKISSKCLLLLFS